MTLTVNVETKNVIKVFTLAVVFTIGVFALFKLQDSILLIVVAFLAALALNPAVSFLARHLPGNRRGPAIAIVFIGVLVAISLLLASIVPPIIRETGSFAQNLPDTVDDLRYRNEHVTGFIEKHNLETRVDSLIASTEERLSAFGESIVSSIGRITSSALSTLSVLVMIVLMLTGGPKLLKQLSGRLYLDEKLRRRHENLAAKMYSVVTGYVNGQLLLASVASLFALGAFILLKTPYPLPLAAIVFLFGLIPLIGNTIAAIIVIFSALILQNLTVALILLAYFILYQQIENITLQPIVQGKTTQLPPLVIFVAVILGVGLVGPIGGLIAIPAAGCARVLLLDYLDHRDSPHLGDSPHTLTEKIKHRLKKVAQPKEASS